MKTNIFIFVAAFVFAACGGNANQQVSETEVQDSTSLGLNDSYPEDDAEPESIPEPEPEVVAVEFKVVVVDKPGLQYDYVSVRLNMDDGLASVDYVLNNKRENALVKKIHYHFDGSCQSLLFFQKDTLFKNFLVRGIA